MKRRCISGIAVLLFGMILGVTAYVEDYYHAQELAFTAITDPVSGVDVYELDGNVCTEQYFMRACGNACKSCCT